MSDYGREGRFGRNTRGIEPDGIYEYVVDLWATSITFHPGHRMRVEITSSSHPR